MFHTSFTELVGCTVPIQMAGMGPLALPRLAAAVANAGALGMLGGGGAPPEYVAHMLEETRRLTDGVFGINFIADGWTDAASGAIDREALAAVEAAGTRARVVEFFYAEPDHRLVELVHSGGALAAWQVGSVEEALASVAAGCDFVVAQGMEAGGHVRGRMSLSALLTAVVRAVKVPIVAAGGIGTGREMAAAMNAGAAGVRVGTRFVAATESEAHPVYVEKLIAAKAEDTVLTEAFSTNWPNAPHRVLRGCLGAMQRSTDEVVGERIRPWAPKVRVPIHRGDAIVALGSTTGRIEAMPHWAGESVSAVKRLAPAADIVQELVSGAELFIRGVNK